jgi:MFS family permease
MPDLQHRSPAPHSAPGTTHHGVPRAVAEPAPPGAGPSGSDPRRRPWSILILLCVAQFMAIVDVTVVNVALPSIGAALHVASPSDLQWVVSAYVLCSGGFLLLGGRAADLLGRRRVFLAGLVTFATASLASGLAPSLLALDVARAAQGLGAALLTPAALAIITTTYTGGQRTTALAAWGAVGGAGAAAGVLLGGLVTGVLGWPWIFFVNVPVGLAAAVFTLRLVPATPRAGRLRDLDLGGAVAATAGLLLLVSGSQGAATSGWGSARAPVSLALAASVLAGFVAIERRVRRPLVPLALWRVRSLLAGA